MRYSRNRDPLETGEIYHVFNRGINRQVIFPDHEANTYFLRLLAHCKRFTTPLTQHAQKVKVFGEQQFQLTGGTAGGGDDSDSKPPRFKIPVELHAYVVMPNHFHLLLRQLVDNGVSHYLNRVCNAYTRAFNQRFSRSGPLWEKRFSAKLIGDGASYLQVSRYIHLNPVKGENSKLSDPADHLYSSYREILGVSDSPICDWESHLDILREPENYREFVLAGFTPEEAHFLKDVTLEDWFED